MRENFSYEIVLHLGQLVQFSEDNGKSSALEFFFHLHKLNCMHLSLLIHFASWMPMQTGTTLTNLTKS